MEEKEIGEIPITEEELFMQIQEDERSESLEGGLQTGHIFPTEDDIYLK